MPQHRHSIVPIPMRPLLSQRLPTLSATRSHTVCSAAPLEALLSPETVLEPLNAATEPWVRAVVWADFRIAVLLFVIMPLALLSSAVYSCRPPALGGERRTQIAEVLLRYMTSYWQASSLLLITVAFNIQQSPLGVPAGLFAQGFILISLWWWMDLNKELQTLKSSALRTTFLVWRALASVAAAGGVLIQAPFQPCVAAPSLAADAGCAAWLEPPQFAAGLVGLSPSPELDLVANSFCGIYVVVLTYYLLVLLPAVGRRGRAPRPSVMNIGSPIGWWRMLGFISEQEER